MWMYVKPHLGDLKPNSTAIQSWKKKHCIKWVQNP